MIIELTPREIIELKLAIATRVDRIFDLLKTELTIDEEGEYNSELEELKLIEKKIS